MSLPFEVLKKRLKSHKTYEECLELDKEIDLFLASNAPQEQKNYIDSLSESLQMCLFRSEPVDEKER